MKMIMPAVDNSTYSRLLAAGLLIPVIVIAWMALAVPYWNMVCEQFRKTSLVHRKYQSMEKIVNNRKKIEQQYRSMMNNRSLSKVYLGNKQGTLAVARLQGTLKRMSEKCGSSLVQSSNVKNSDKHRITANVTMTGDIKSVYCSLHKIGNDWPVMTVNNIDITGSNNTRYGNQNKTIQLQARFDVTAYIKK